MLRTFSAAVVALAAAMITRLLREPSLEAEPPPSEPPPSEPPPSEPPAPALPVASRSNRLDKVVSAAQVLTSVSALLVALLTIPTSQAATQAAQDAVQSQITGRFNAAVEQLGSTEERIRLGGIFALERIAQDSERDQPVIVEVLSAFIREVTRAGAQNTSPAATDSFLPSDVQAALTVVSRRSIIQDEDYIDLSKSYLAGVILRGPQPSYDLSRAVFRSANLSQANLQEVNLQEADFTEANLSGAKLSTTLTEAVFVDADLQRAELGGAQAGGVNFNCANANGIIANGTPLQGALMRGTSLVEAKLGGAIMQNADLTQARLDGAELDGAQLGSSTLTSASLRGADLTRANLTNAILTGADLAAADLAGADLRGADLTAAKNVTSAQFRSAVTDGTTRMPINLDVPDDSQSPDLACT